MPIASNSIVLENQKAGTPESTWAIHGSMANQGNTQIEGFATQISINVGQTVDFKIDDSVSGGYTIDIYRLGYYGGNGARLVASMHDASGTNQPNPTFNSSTRTVDAGNWAVTNSWAVPADATSGVYFAKLTSDNGNYQNIIPFIVRNDGTASDIVFQTSDTTWQAYNPWGGYNLYTGPDQKNTDRAYAVSYNRPIAMNSTANESQAADYLFGEEYAAIYWLEQNGYSVNYISGIDAATNASSLLNAKTYLDVGHDEYWTQSQYANVQAAAAAGVNLAFLSGNNAYWDSALAPDINGVPNRTLIQYKDIWSGAQLNPNGTSGGGTGLFRDPVYGPGTPENALVGTLFTVDETHTLDDISVPASMSQLRFWANTNIASGQGGTLQNLLGYEWNSDLNNGFRPTGLVDLSSTTRNVGSLLLDNGATTGNGTATHNLTLYRNTTSGALVFSAGTVMWSWGLDNEYVPYRGLTAPVSPAVQQAMVNLFADMGVQPQTLLASLQLAQQSTDHTSPVAVITTPIGGQNYTVGQNVTITGTASDVGGKAAGVEVSTDGGKTWNLATGTTNWSYSWTAKGSGSVLIEARAIDDSVNLQSNPSTVTVNLPVVAPWSGLFSTSDAPANTFNDHKQIEVGVKFTSAVAGSISGIEFYKAVGDTGTDVVDLWSSTGTRLATGTFSNTSASGWQTVTFSSPVAITAGTTYVASYHSTGTYAATSNYFTTPHTNGSLTAPSSAGVYAYGGTATTGIFPTNTYQASNYFVDVVFNPNGPNQPPVANADSLTITQNGPASIMASTLLANDTDANSNPLTVTGVSGATNGTVSFDAANNTMIFTPTTGYTGPASFNYAISDGQGGTASAAVNLAVVTNQLPVAVADSGFTTIQNTAITIAGSTLLANDTDGNGDPLIISGVTSFSSGNGTASFNAATNSVTFTPTTGYTGPASFNYSISDGHGGSASNTVSLNVTAPAATQGLLSTSDAPANTFNDRKQIEVGVKFTSAVAGSISGIEFYKAVGDTGTDVVDLWTSTGTRLATGTFSNTSASGWQTVTFSSPVAITAGTTYVASYHSTGTYAATNNYFTTPHTNGSLTAPSSAGVYAYGGTATTGIFPTNTYQASNYFVDVVFNPNGPNQPPVANADSLTITQNGPATIMASTLLANDTDANSNPLTVTGVSGATNGTVSFNAASNTMTFTPTTGYTGPASFNYAISDGQGGTASSAVNLAVVTNQLPVAVADSGFTTIQNTAVTIAGSTLLANDTDGNGDPLIISGVTSLSNGNGTASFNAATNSVTFTPTTGYTGLANFNYSISDGHGGSASNTVSLNVTAPAATQGLFSTSDAPANTFNDRKQIEVGVKFTSAVAGSISGIEFYKAVGDTGTDVVDLWTSTGTRLATGTFSNTSASGWQTVTFSSPVAITAGTTYVASYHSTGTYAATNNYFTTPHTNGSLTAPSSAGVYAYGGTATTGIFPTNTYLSTNYFVDVVFNPLPTS